jgi:hypothetical protein
MLLLLTFLGCDNACHSATKLIPALEKVDPSWGADPVDCEASHAPPDGTIGCIHKKIQCNSVLEDTTRGGKSHFGDDFYQQGWCTPQRNDYEDSPEAIYQLRVPPNTKVDLRLDSNCADLDLVAMSWQETKCPTQGSTVQRECEMDTKATGGTLVLTTTKNPQTYLIAIDGKQGDYGNFRLTTKCGLYR